MEPAPATIPDFDAEDAKPLTSKQEAFSLAILTAKNQSDAYRASYCCEKMSPAAIAVEASRLMADPRVALRVRGLRQAVADAAVMQKRELLERMTKMARLSVKDLFDSHGNPIEPADLPPGADDLVCCFEFFEAGKGENRVATRKYRMTPKLEVYRELAKILHDQPETPPLPTVTITNNTIIVPHEAYYQLVRGQ